ncbi:MAG: protein kinase domain-containing protein, partial [Planctomycetota bacterium]
RVMGTPSYMSPEQACGLGVDHSSDQYSLGCTLFHMLTGAPPFHGSEAKSVLQSHIHDPVPDPDARRDEPSPWSPLCRRLMAKAPAERFVDPGELLKTVEELLAERSLTTASGRRRRPHVRRARLRSTHKAPRSRPRERTPRSKPTRTGAGASASTAPSRRQADAHPARRCPERPAKPKAETPSDRQLAPPQPDPDPAPNEAVPAARLHLPVSRCALGLRRLATVGARVFALPLAPGWRVRVVLGRHHLLTVDDEARGYILALPRERMLPLVLQTVLAERIRARRLGPQVWLTESLAILSRGLERRWQTVPAAMRLRRPLQRLRQGAGATGPLAYEPATHGSGGSEIIALARITNTPILPVSYSAIPGALWGTRRCLVAAPLATILVGFAAPLVPDPAQPPALFAAALEARMQALNRDLDRRSGLAD